MASNWMSRLTKDFGMLASDIKITAPKPIPAWSPSLNWATTQRGFTPGKVNIVYGPESAGKSLLAQMAIIELQRRDPEAIAIWFDSEFSFNVTLFEKLGGDSSRLIVRKSNNPILIFDYIGGELLEMLQDGAPVKAIVIDSVKAIRYPKDVRKNTTDQIMGGSGSAYLGSALKLIIPVIAEYKLLTFFVQQVSAQIDPMKAMRNPYVITEGHALKHAADLMLEVTRLDTKNGVIEQGDTIAGGTAQLGHKVRIKVRKNRLGVPARVAQFTFHYEKGITDTGGEVFDLAKALGVLGKKDGCGNSIYFREVKVGRGLDDARTNVSNNKDLQDEILEACYSHKDAPVEVDASGFVEDKEDYSSVEV
jgi:recombination protein RecA